MSNAYHHGDLPTALIQAGIELIDSEGVGALSLRRVAVRCGVSHTAPYSHFKDKEALLAAMREHVTEQFAAALQAAREGAGSPKAETETQVLQHQLQAMGVTYVAFFRDNPAYYTFLFAQPDMRVNLDDLEDEGNYRPFEIFKQVALRALKEIGAPRQALLAGVVNMWALVHGIAAMAIMPCVQFTGDWETLTAGIIQNEFAQQPLPCGCTEATGGRP